MSTWLYILVRSNESVMDIVLIHGSGELEYLSKSVKIIKSEYLRAVNN